MNNSSIINYSLIWERIGEMAKKIGRGATRPMILLYYVMRSKDTPKAEKLMIFSSLAYVVLPIDLISARRLPIIGWLDEVVSLTVAYQKIQRYITPSMEADADALLDKWFPEYTPYVMIED